MNTDRRAELNQRFREKHILDAMEDLGNAIESLTEEEENYPLWTAVSHCRDLCREHLQTFCKHEFATPHADNQFNPRCKKCWYRP